MARMKQKTKRFGFALRVRMKDVDGVEKWERVGFNFATKQEAATYRERHYPATTRWTITGIRLNMEPMKADRADMGGAA